VILGQVFAGVARIGTGLEARWVGCAPDVTQRVYVANHTSHADSVLLWAAFRGDCGRGPMR